jgi:predicted nucleic acid-binding protein
MSATVVLDANAFIRSAEGDAEASAWVGRIESGEVIARAPDLLFVEVANTVLVQSRAGLLDLESAVGIVDVLCRLPIRIASLRELAVPALRVAEERGLSAYDASYVVLAEQAQATRLTADRRVAAAARGSVLLD